MQYYYYFLFQKSEPSDSTGSHTFYCIYELIILNVTRPSSHLHAMYDAPIWFFCTGCPS